jgi:hypothetical protein
VTQGSCEILEVAHEIRTEKVEISQVDVQETVQRIKELEKEKKVLCQEISRAASRRRLIQSYAKAAMASPTVTAAPLPINTSEDSSSPLRGAIAILDYHRQEMFQLDELETELEERLSALTETVTVLESNLRKTKNKNTKEKFTKTRAVSILVNVLSLSQETARGGGGGEREGEGGGEGRPVHLLLSYVVSNATWSPSYDLRIDTVRSVMDLTYFAEVTQQSGEDWTDCEVSLSTSNPAIGSSPPPLPTRSIDWSYNCSQGDPLLPGRAARGNNKFNSSNSINFKSSSVSRHRESSAHESSDDEVESVSMIEEQLRPYESQTPTAPPLPNNTDLTVSGNDAGSTTFVIPRKVTIESDNKPHKVTVTTASLTPQMVHYVSPALSAFVYLQAKTQNTSPYPLLPSQRVAVFLDGNFISTTSVKQTSSGEYFNVFLGVDPTVKVQYMPCRTSQHVKGWLSGTEVKKYFYSTIVHNTKQRSVRMILAEIFPRSADEKIVIELLDPSPSVLVRASSDTAPILNEQDLIAGLDGFEGSVHGGGAGGAGAEGGVAPSSQRQAWPRDFVTQNKFTNNIVWLKTLQPGEKTEVKFSYRVTWPQGQGVGIR